MNALQDTDDPYRAAAKPPYPARCPTCAASFVAGRWSWRKAPAGAAPHVCPACQRIADQLPGGYVTLRGPFLEKHREEVIRLVKAREALALTEHPLQRIMAVENTASGLVVTTTDAHLAHRIAHALHDAYKGEMRLNYSKGENLLRATWSR
jgi:hypothetical protein